MYLLRRLQNVALKRLYKFILKRILGPFLADELDLDQLDVELSKGLLHLGDLELNVAPLNDVLAAAKAPFRAESGYIHRVKVTINSDDPPHFGSSIGHEYAMAAKTWGYDAAMLTSFTRTAIEAAFVDEPTREKLLGQLG